MNTTADVVIVGAGIGGVSAAYHLTVRHGVRDLVLVDPRPPLTLTSDKSTECYRNWWPDRPMVGLMNRSIDIYEELQSLVDLGHLSERECRAMVLRDLMQLPLSDAAARIYGRDSGMTRHRLSQVHTVALKKLRGAARKRAI